MQNIIILNQIWENLYNYNYHADAIFNAKMYRPTKFNFGWALPQTPLKELTATELFVACAWNENVVSD